VRIRFQRNYLKGREQEEAPEETTPEAAATFKKGQLRLPMAEREQVVSKLVELEHRTWALEGSSGPRTHDHRISRAETPVPTGSLSSEEGMVKL
jgi:hypothetical protein